MGKYTVENDYARRVDPETGEILEFVKNVKVVKTEVEPFFLTYSKEILALYGKSFLNATTKVFYKLPEFAEYNTGMVYMTSSRRDEIMKVCKISKTSFYRAVDELVECGVMTKDKDTYIIDERMFWKGDRKTRDMLKKARLKVSFSPVYEDDEQEEWTLDNDEEVRES